MTTITLTGDYGSTPYKASGLAAGTLIDAENASWTQDNDGSDGSPYPFMVYDSPGAILDGGTINGKVDMTGDWRDVYNDGNSAGVRTEGTPDVVIRDWHITNTWDAVRVSWDSPNFLIEDVWVTNARDDAVENDRLQTGTIRDSLFDGVFGGISVDPSSSSPVDGHNNTVTLDGVLMRMQSFLYEGEMTHSSMIKTDSATDGELTPNLRFINTVFAIEDVEHHSYRSMQDAWNNTVESKGNVFLNLSDKPLPDDYPMPPEGWTVLQGQAARDYWQEAKTEWIERHSGEEGTTPDSPATEQPVADHPPVAEQPPLAAEPASFSGVSFKGASDGETIIGNELDNIIDAGNGNDVVKGSAGNDVIRGNDGVDKLWGGSGNDTFLMERLGDSRENGGIDTIMDFAAGDKIKLSAIDANRELTGDQAFHLIQGDFSHAPGELKVSYDAGSDTTVVSGNVDTDVHAEFTLWLHGQVNLTSGDFVL